MFNGARLVGPSVAGVLIASVGEGMCFLLDGFSYLAVIGSLLAMHIKKKQGPSKGGTMLRGLAEGFRKGRAPRRLAYLRFPDGGRGSGSPCRSPVSRIPQVRSRAGEDHPLHGCHFRDRAHLVVFLSDPVAFASAVVRSRFGNDAITGLGNDHDLFEILQTML
jgi:hypothetical protein